MIREMFRLAIWGLTSERSEVVETLHDFGLVHVVAPAEFRSPSEQEETLKFTRAKVLGMLEALEWKDWGSFTDETLEKSRQKVDFGIEGVVPEIDRSLDSFRERLASLLEERRKLTLSQSDLKKAHQVVFHFIPFVTAEDSPEKESA